MKNLQLKEKMFALCREWEVSGKTKSSFCKEQGINPAKFGYWRSQYLSSQKEVDGFVSVRAEPPSINGTEIRYPNGVVVIVPAGTSIVGLKALINFA